jgi:phasin family protein
MSDTNFDPNTVFEAYRQAIAPTAKAQQESFKTIERLGRYQYAVAGDCLHWVLAQAKTAVTVQTPAEFISRQMELATVLSERLRVLGQQFVSLATDAQTGFSQVVSETTASVVEAAKKAA